MVAEMTDLKVCLLTPEFLPVWGGTGSYCVELANALSDKVELHIATVNRLGNNSATAAKQDFYLYKGKVAVHSLTKSSDKDTFFFNGKMQVAVSRKLPALIREYHFDVLHSNFPAMPDLLFRFFSRAHYKTLTTVHTTIEMHRAGTTRSKRATLKSENSERMTHLLLPYLLRSQRFYLSKEKNFIFVSRFVQSAVQNSYGNIIKGSKNWVINNGVDVKAFSPEKGERFRDFFPNLAEKQSLILFSGRLIALKGISVLAKAMKIVIAADKDVHFVFAGPGSLELLNENIRANDIPSDRYTALGAVDRANMPYLYAQSKMLVLPSYVESLPLCVLEAMSSGTPVIASNVGGLPEIINNGHDGLLFEAGRSDELAAKIIYLLKNARAARDISLNARRKLIDNFSVNKMANDTLRVYESIMR